MINIPINDLCKHDDIVLHTIKGKVIYFSFILSKYLLFVMKLSKLQPNILEVDTKYGFCKT